MNYYEILYIVNPNFERKKIDDAMKEIEDKLKKTKSKIINHVIWGKKKLAYPIQDQFKASYGLINVECNQEAVEEIKNSFKFNDSIIRNLVLGVKKALTDDSALLLQTKEDNEKDSYQEAREQVERSDNKNLQNSRKSETPDSELVNEKETQQEIQEESKQD